VHFPVVISETIPITRCGLPNAVLTLCGKGERT
jgi:hypothetical protein